LLPSRPAGLIDILDRVLDKGLVVAGDIKISLVSVELLTIKIRLLICSIDKAEEIGLNWWRFDPELTGRTGGGPDQSVGAGEAAGPQRLGEARAGGEPEALDDRRLEEALVAEAPSRGNGDGTARRRSGTRR